MTTKRPPVLALDSFLVNAPSPPVYDAALQINPRRASSLYGRGMAKLKTGNSTDATRDIAAAKALQPNIAEEFATFGIR
jgi:hypothetical protein